MSHMSCRCVSQKPLCANHADIQIQPGNDSHNVVIQGCSDVLWTASRLDTTFEKRYHYSVSLIVSVDRCSKWNYTHDLTVHLVRLQREILTIWGPAHIMRALPLFRSYIWTWREHLGYDLGWHWSEVIYHWYYNWAKIMSGRQSWIRRWWNGVAASIDASAATYIDASYQLRERNERGREETSMREKKDSQRLTSLT